MIRSRGRSPPANMPSPTFVENDDDNNDNNNDHHSVADSSSASRRSPSNNSHHHDGHPSPSSVSSSVATTSRTYSSALSTSATHKATKLLRSSTGNPLSTKGADSFESIWRERVSGDAILCNINSSSSSSATATTGNTTTASYNDQKDDRGNQPFASSTTSSTLHPHLRLPGYQSPNAQRRFALAPASITDPGSAFVGIPHDILSSSERAGLTAQFQEGSFRIPKDLTRIRIGLSTAIQVSVSVPDDILYDLLIAGKTGIFLLRQLRAEGFAGGSHHRDSTTTGDNDNDDSSSSMSILSPQSRFRKKSINFGGEDPSVVAVMKEGSNNHTNTQKQSHHHHHQQFEVSMQALIDVAMWIKYQMDSDRHPTDAAAEESPCRERLEVLNSEVADSVSLFEAASTTMNQNKHTSSSNNANSGTSSSGGNTQTSQNAKINQSLGSNKASTKNPSGGQQHHHQQAQLRLTPRAALASVFCEPPAVQQKQKKHLASSSTNASSSRRRYRRDLRDLSSSSSSDSDDEDNNVDDTSGERRKSKVSKDENNDDDDPDEKDGDGDTARRRKSTTRGGGAGASSGSTTSASKKIKPPDVEARKELKKFLATDPWRQTAAALFTSLGGDVFATTNGTLPYPVVERVVRLTLHRRIEHAAVEGAVAALCSKYDGHRLSLIEFDLDVVRPLARLLGCDSGSGGANNNGQQGDVGVSSQIRAAQHVIKLFMTPASKLAKDEAARFRGKRNFKDSEELLLAAKFSIERVKNRLGELRIIDPHVDKIFKNPCILEGTGLTHILDLSRFALQDFVQKVKDNRPIAVNPTMALRRKIVDKFISGVEKAARVLYDHSSACARCKRIADVIRNHIAEQRQKESTFHQQFYERQRSMVKNEHGDDPVLDKLARKAAKRQRMEKRERKKRLRRLLQLKNEKAQKKLEAEIAKQDSTGGVLSHENSLIALAGTHEDDDERVARTPNINNDGDDEEEENNDEFYLNGELAELLSEFGEEEEEEEDDWEESSGTSSSSTSNDDEAGQKKVKEAVLSNTASQASASKTGSDIESKNNSNRVSNPSSPKTLHDQTSMIFAKTFDSYFSDINSDDATSKKTMSKPSSPIDGKKKRSKSNTGGKKNSSKFINPHPPHPATAESSFSSSSRPPHNQKGERRKSSSVKPPPKAEHYIKPKDDPHECRMRSSQVREIFRMIQMKGTTVSRTEKRLKSDKPDDGIGPGWKTIQTATK